MQHFEMVQVYLNAMADGCVLCFILRIEIYGGLQHQLSNVNTRYQHISNYTLR